MSEGGIEGEKKEGGREDGRKMDRGKEILRDEGNRK